MSGLNPVKKLNEQGIDAKEGRVTKVDVEDIHIPTSGSLAHPRASDPPDPELVAHIKAFGVTDAVIVRRDGVIDGKLRLTLIDGSRRTIALIEAIRQLEADRALRDGQRYIPVEFFVGDDKAALKIRLRKNDVDPLKKPDSLSVLAKTAVQLHQQQATIEEILEVMPRVVDSKATLESLMRWGDLTPEAAAKFDTGAPLGLLGAVLDAPREEQVAVADRLVAAGMTSSKGATRLLNRERGPAGAGRPKPLRASQTAAIVDVLAPFADTGDVARAVIATFRVASGDREALAAFPDEIRGLVENELQKPVKRGRIAGKGAA